MYQGEVDNQEGGNLHLVEDNSLDLEGGTEEDNLEDSLEDNLKEKDMEGTEVEREVVKEVAEVVTEVVMNAVEGVEMDAVEEEEVEVAVSEVENQESGE